MLCAALAAFVAPAALVAALLLWTLRPGDGEEPFDGRALALALAGVALLALVGTHVLGLLRPLPHSIPVDREAMPLGILVVVAWFYLGARLLLEGATRPVLDRARVVLRALYVAVEVAVG